MAAEPPNRGRETRTTLYFRYAADLLYHEKGLFVSITVEGASSTVEGAMGNDYLDLCVGFLSASPAFSVSAVAGAGDPDQDS